MREIEREPIGIIETESGFAIELGARGESLCLIIEHSKTAHERGAKACLFEAQGFGDQRFGADEFGIGLTHFAHESRHKTPHQRIARAQQLRMTHSAAHDPAQHIAAAFIGGQNAISNQKRRGAQMIGDHAMAGAAITLRRHTRGFF